MISIKETAVVGRIPVCSARVTDGRSNWIVKVRYRWRGKSRTFDLMWHLSNSYLQTRCSCCNREDNTSGRLKGGELFPSPSVHHSMLFLIQFVDNRLFSRLRVFMHTFHSYFLRLVVSHALFSTDARFFLFPAISGCSGARGSDG